MDPHPTPFPGKRRPAAAATNPIKRDRDLTKPPTSRKPAPPTLVASQTRPKRVFGTARSNNIPVEKPLPKPSLAKISKPWKPSVPSAAAQKAAGNLSGGRSDKAKVAIKKTHQVCFQEPATAEVEGIEKRVQDDGVRTPISSIKPLAEVTPYLSAENCSKCRFDRFEGSSYWLGQIKLAETVGKHFVSAAFFRLALECHAQPFPSLQSELKHYVARHGVISSETLWSDLCQAYGLLKEQPDSDPCDLDAVFVEQEDVKPNIRDKEECDISKDEILEYDIIDKPPISEFAEKEPVELIDANVDELKDDICTKEPADGMPRPISSKDCPSKSCGSGKKSLEGVAQGKKSYIGKSTMPSTNDSSSTSRTHGLRGSSNKGGEVHSSSKISGGKLMRIDAVGARGNQSSQLRSKGKEDEKGMSPDLSDNLNSLAIGEDPITIHV